MKSSRRPRSGPRAPLSAGQLAMIALAAVAAILAAGCTKAPAARAAATPALVTVPFVGCASDGQTGPQAAPSGAAKAVRIDAAAALKLAYYSDGSTGGVLAPRGWSCFGTYGSSGSTLYVAPQPLASAEVLSMSWGGLAGPGVQLSVSTGDTSGRFTVAAVIARVFPSRMAFAKAVIGEGLEPASAFPSGPFPGDQMTARGDTVAEFVTPANAQGLGSAYSRLKPDGDPISGVAILAGPTPDLALAAVRLAGDQANLAPTTIRQLEQDEAPNLTASGAPSPAAGAPPAGDSAALGVVNAFYAALSSGDGARASALVVPAKRQTRAFSAAALTRFYSSLGEPIQLTAATTAGDGSVSVRYHYAFASGKVCNGRATVQTTGLAGPPLIEKITALNGC